LLRTAFHFQGHAGSVVSHEPPETELLRQAIDERPETDALDRSANGETKALTGARGQRRISRTSLGAKPIGTIPACGLRSPFPSPNRPDLQKTPDCPIGPEGRGTPTHGRRAVDD
jgi:hypothetical protein